MTPKEINEKIKELRSEVQVNVSHLPDGESLNSLLVGDKIGEIDNLLHSRVLEPKIKQPAPLKHKSVELPVFKPEPTIEAEKIHIISEQHITYHGDEAIYHAKGQLSYNQKTLDVLLVIEDKFSRRKHRYQVDLYKSSHVNKVCEELSEIENYNTDKMLGDVETFTNLLEDHREQLMTKTKKKTSVAKPVSAQLHQKAVELLQDKHLLNRINELIEMAGVVGEENTRLSLFVMASTYKMQYPIHTLIQGMTGSGKSHLLNTIAACFPPEDVLSMTRVTSKSFYHYGEDELVNKLLLIQDFDGLDDEAQFAFREMQSAGHLSCSTTIKDRFGNLKAGVKHVDAHFASIVSTTKAEVYSDNMNRSVVVGIDESEGQTRKILMHQNRLTAGLIGSDEIEQARELLRSLLRQLHPKSVVNHYADKVMLPLQIKSVRRLNNQFQALVAQVTLLHQFQRQVDDKGRLVATIEDLTQAVELFTDAIYMKVDELDSSSRQFFERMKEYVKSRPNGTTQRFTARDIRQALNANKTEVHRFLETLKSLEYISIVEGTANRGYKYSIIFWDDAQKMRTQIKDELTKQISEIEPPQAINGKAHNAGVSTIEVH